MVRWTVVDLVLFYGVPHSIIFCEIFVTQELKVWVIEHVEAMRQVRKTECEIQTIVKISERHIHFIHLVRRVRYVEPIVFMFMLGNDFVNPVDEESSKQNQCRKHEAAAERRAIDVVYFKFLVNRGPAQLFAVRIVLIKLLTGFLSFELAIFEIKLQGLLKNVEVGDCSIRVGVQ